MIFRTKVPKTSGFSFAWWPRKLRDGNWAWLERTGWSYTVCDFGVNYEYWELWK